VLHTTEKQHVFTDFLLWIVIFLYMLLSSCFSIYARTCCANFTSFYGYFIPLVPHWRGLTFEHFCLFWNVIFCVCYFRLCSLFTKEHAALTLPVFTVIISNWCPTGGTYFWAFFVCFFLLMAGMPVEWSAHDDKKLLCHSSVAADHHMDGGWQAYMASGMWDSTETL
jgi:hypothetical protein